MSHEEIDSAPGLTEQLRSASGADDDDTVDRALIEVFRELADESSFVGDGLTGLIDRINRLPQAVGGRLSVPTSSRVPGGALAHWAVGKATSRYDAAVLERVRALAQEISECLREALDADLGSLARRLARVGADLEATADAVAAMEVRLSGGIGRLAEVEERLRRLERAERDRGFQPWFSELDFGEAFRGSRKNILDRYHEIADIAAATGGPVLDLGCGRGELVELLVTRDVPVWGVEIDPGLVEFCRSIYLDVRLADAATALANEPDGSLGSITLIQVVEHLTAQQLIDLVPQMASKVRVGGVVIAETVNAISPYVFTRSFYLDPTHTNPVHHEYLEFLFRQAGFRHVETRWRSMVPDDERLPNLTIDPEPTSSTIREGNAIINRLNQFLFAPQDYALVAVR